MKIDKFQNSLELISTLDGSLTIYSSILDETYHSRNGAFQESMHVFIQNGLMYASEKFDELNILEVGLGTFLNLYLTIQESYFLNKPINYVGLEPYPIPTDLHHEYINQALFDKIDRVTYKKLVDFDWCAKTDITSEFKLLKCTSRVQDFKEESGFNLVYFDAFAPKKDEEMWTYETLTKISELMATGGIFVTYAANSNLRRNLVDLGFEIEKPKGALGKREMIRATKR